MTMRPQVHLWLDQGTGDDVVAVALHRGLVVLITAGVLAIVMESVPSIAARFCTAFQIFEFVSLVIFALESIFAR